jgi:hypothetical protein
MGKGFQYEAFRKLDGKTPNENARGMLRNRRDAALTADGEYGSCAAAPTCVENSPERRGELGCSIIEDKLLPNGPKGPLFWHIDRFDSAERARTAVGPASVAFEAAGTSWVMTMESQTSNHHGGRHVAQVGPPQLPRAAKYSMQVMSAAFTPRMYSLAHHHPASKLCTCPACWRCGRLLARRRRSVDPYRESDGPGPCLVDLGSPRAAGPEPDFRLCPDWFHCHSGR